MSEWVRLDTGDEQQQWMAMWTRVYLSIAEYAEAEQEAEALRIDAERWRALMASDRIRFIGGSKHEETWNLVGFDFHAVHPDKDDAESRAILLSYVDSLRGQMK